METNTLLDSGETNFYEEQISRNKFFRSKIGSKRQRNRLVQKYGICNISLINVPKQSRKYFRLAFFSLSYSANKNNNIKALQDIFTTVIEVKWRWCLVFFSMSFFLSWSLFTGIYYLLALYHGDLERDADDDTWDPCIRNGNSVINIFLFAFTTQTTIGYGFRYPTDACPLVVGVMCVQFMVGVMCQTLMAGVIFAKLARPIKRAATIMFSKNAVICMRNGKLCLQFRVGDMRKSLLAEAHVRLQMIKKCITLEGETLPFHQFDMNVGYDTGLDRVFVIWPITICHEINEDSPLYEMSKESLSRAKFEIIALLEGVVESVGSTTQARTSYLPDEILWGKRFVRLLTHQRENGQYKINLEKFHDCVDVEGTPTCSAKELDEMESSMASSLVNIPPHIALQLASKEGSEIDFDTALRQRYQAATNRINIESDEDDNDPDILHRPVYPSNSFSKKLSTPDSEIRRKQSQQIRRGPDLF